MRPCQWNSTELIGAAPVRFVGCRCRWAGAVVEAMGGLVVSFGGGF